MQTRLLLCREVRRSASFSPQRVELYLHLAPPESTSSTLLDQRSLSNESSKHCEDLCLLLSWMMDPFLQFCPRGIKLTYMASLPTVSSIIKSLSWINHPERSPWLRKGLSSQLLTTLPLRFFRLPSMPFRLIDELFAASP